jgi:polyphosphate glucokinase
MTVGPRRIDTPHPATPEAVIDGLVGLVGSLGPFERISIGFPGVVRDGLVLTAPNLGTTAWHGFPLAATLAKKLRAPARLANDATVQGLGVISGHGVECVITLGTGMGFALFENARPAPHLELSQHPARGRKTYDQYIGNAALRAVGRKAWNKRVRKAIDNILILTSCDVLYIGGGNAKNLQLELPATVRIVSNEAGITGGLRLWDALPDTLFESISA